MYDIFVSWKHLFFSWPTFTCPSHHHSTHSRMKRCRAIIVFWISQFSFAKFYFTSPKVYVVAQGRYDMRREEAHLRLFPNMKCTWLIRPQLSLYVLGIGVCVRTAWCIFFWIWYLYSLKLKKWPWDFLLFTLYVTAKRFSKSGTWYLVWFGKGYRSCHPSSSW